MSRAISQIENTKDAKENDAPIRQVVLLVDDEPNLLRALTRTLREQPYQIWTACSANEAIDVMKSHQVDLVVSDENMPGMYGTVFLTWVAEHFPEVPRMILTGQPSVASSLNAINNAHVCRYFTKPCDALELGLAIREELERIAATNAAQPATS